MTKVHVLRHNDFFFPYHTPHTPFHPSKYIDVLVTRTPHTVLPLHPAKEARFDCANLKLTTTVYIPIEKHFSVNLPPYKPL